MKIVIVGGRGEIGSLFATLWSSQGHQILVLDRDDWDNALEILSHADLVVIAVPIAQTAEVTEIMVKYLSEHTILADLTSIKALPLKTMLDLHKGPILALHPTFGPNITLPKGQVIINCGGRDLAKSAWVLSSLLELGFKIIEMSAEKHDEIMGFIQGIEHFNTFILGTFLKKYDLHPEEMFAVASPIYQAKLAMLGRIFDQDAKLYADIIMSDVLRVELIEKYAKYLNSWVSDLHNLDKNKFIDTFNATSSWMGEFTHKSLLASDEFLTQVNQIYAKTNTLD